MSFPGKKAVLTDLLRPALGEHIEKRHGKTCALTTAAHTLIFTHYAEFFHNVLSFLLPTCSVC